MDGVPAPKAVDEAIGNNLTEFPCRCGETHKGDYGIYDYGHHMCFHDKYPLTWLEKPISAMCIQCGMVFGIEEGEE